MPKASFVIPAYNAEPFIHQCLDSVLEQTVNDFEIVVVDDCSTDETASILESYSARDPRVRVLRNERNSGVAVTRNVGLDAAEGEWMIALDSDDWIHKNRLERILNTVDQTTCDIICDDLSLMLGDELDHVGNLLRDEKPGISTLDAVRFVEMDAPDQLGYGILKPAVRRQFLLEKNIKYNPDIAVVDDFLFVADCFAHGAVCALINEPLYFYRIHANSLSRTNAAKTVDQVLKATSLSIAAFSENGAHDVVRALDQRRKSYEYEDRYRKVVDPVIRGNVLQGVLQLGGDIGIAPYIAKRIAVRLQRGRWQ